MSVEIAHAERTHALLSASSAKQWLTCTPSARLSEQFPDKQNEYTLEGTLAHEMAELMMRKACVEPMGPRKFNTAMKKLEKQLKEHENWDQSMHHHVETYYDYIMGIVHQFTTPPYVAVEKRVDYSEWAPEGYGTCDCLIISGDTLYINDLKFGKGVPVSAEGNPQLRLYALGAWHTYAILYPIQQVKMTIIQPRKGEPSEETITLQELLAWGESIKPIAKRAFEGAGEPVTGDHCRWCRANKTCRARVEEFLSLETFGNLKPPLISDDEVGDILKRAEGLDKWVKALKEYALTQSLNGAKIAGWKAVEGRTLRDYTEIDKAFEHLKAKGINEALLYKREPLTVAQLEKELTKPVFRELVEQAGFIKTSTGKPTLVPETDKRKEITNQVSAAEAFGTN